MSFQFGYATYNFETTIRSIAEDGNRMECFFPGFCFYSEKRSLKRESPESGLRLELVLPPPFSDEISGPIIDLSDTGASFLADGDSIALLPGTPVGPIRIFDNGRLIREERGKSATSSGSATTGPPAIVTASIRNRPPKHPDRSPPPPEHRCAGAAEKADRAVDPSLPAVLQELSHRPPAVIRLENSRGEEIVGLLNSSYPFGRHPSPSLSSRPRSARPRKRCSAWP